MYGPTHPSATIFVTCQCVCARDSVRAHSNAGLLTDTTCTTIHQALSVDLLGFVLNTPPLLSVGSVFLSVIVNLYVSWRIYGTSLFLNVIKLFLKMSHFVMFCFFLLLSTRPLAPKVADSRCRLQVLAWRTSARRLLSSATAPEERVTTSPTNTLSGSPPSKKEINSRELLGRGGGESCRSR